MLHIYSFFPLSPFLSTYLLVLFSVLYSPKGILLQFCFPVCALISFVLVDTIFGFLCSPGQSIVINFCWTVLILLMGVFVYVYIQSVSTVVINLYLYIGLLQFCGVFLFLFFIISLTFFFFFFYNFKF